ncbi:MAG: ArsR/SmtB family transcription factor [Candidatus Sumerlaeaceae bacterium]
MTKLRLHQILRLLSNERRLRIVNLLLELEREVCVCELQDLLKLPQATLSQLIAPLRQVGLLSSRKEKQWVHYSVSREFRAWLRKVISHFPEGDEILEKDRVAYARLAPSCRPVVARKAAPSGKGTLSTQPRTQSTGKETS